MDSILEELRNKINELEIQNHNNKKYYENEIEVLRYRAEILNESEQKYRNIVEYSTSFVLEWDTDGNILYLNKFGLDFFGFTPQEIIGKNVLGTIVEPVDTVGFDLAKKMDVVQHNPQDFYSSENENVKKNGEKVWIAWTNKGIYDNDGNLIKTLSIGIDRTKQHEMEKEIAEYRERLEYMVDERTSELSATNEKLTKEIEERITIQNELFEKKTMLKSILDNFQDAFFRADINGNFTIVNNTSLIMYGYDSIEELLGSPASNLYARKEDRDSLIEELRSKGYVNDKTLLAKRKDGGEFWVSMNVKFIRDSEGNIIGTEGITRDISERKKAEIAIKESEEKYRYLYDNAIEGMFRTSIEGKSLQANKSMAAILGYSSPEEAINYINSTANQVWLYPEERELYLSLLKTNHIVKDYECKLKRNDGSIIWVSVTSKLVFDESGKPIHIDGFISDITERKTAQELLIEQNKNLERQYEEYMQLNEVLRTTNYDLEIAKSKAEESEKELKMQNELFKILLNNLTQGVFMVEAPSGKPIMANESAKKILGRGILPDADHHNISEVYEAFLAETMEPYPSDKMPILRGMYGESLYIDNMIVKKPDGLFTYLEVYGTPVYNDDNKIWASLVSFNDITERKKNEEKIKKNEARLEGLLRISQYKSESINDLLDYALNEAIELTDSKIGYIYLYNESKEEFTLNSWSKEVMAECKVIEPQTIYQLEKTGLWGEAVRQRKPILENNFQHENPYKKGYPEGHVTLEKFLTLPIYFNDSIVAVVGVANKSTDYDNSDIRQLTLMMDSVWKLLEQKNVEITLQDQNQKLEQQYEESYLMNEQLRVANYDLELAKSKAEDSEMLFRRIIEASPVPMALNDELQNIIYLNIAFIETFGYKLDDIPTITQWWITAYPNQEYRQWVIDSWQAELERANATNTKFNPLEVNITCKNGEVRTVLAGATSLVKSFMGNHLVVLYDITERKHSELLLIDQNKQLDKQYEEYMQLNEVLRVTNYELEEAKSKAEESEKLKSAFLQNISHEIRTPLNGILGFTSLLGYDDLDSNDRDEFLRMIKKSGKRLQIMVENIIEVSKISTSQINLNIREFDLKSLFDDVLHHNLDYFIQQNLSWNIEFNNCELNLIHSDFGKLELIMNSLVNNAIKFSNKGEIVIGCKFQDEYYIFYVKDDGIGISPEHQEKIFDNFYQADSSISRDYEGAGLGLSICKGLVELLGGKIWVESEVGKGSTFWFSLPKNTNFFR